MIKLTPETHRQYFEALAAANINIAHNEATHKQFVCVDMDEVEESVFEKLDLSQWCMVLEDLTGRINGADAEHLAVSANAAFLIFKHVKEGDRDQERIVLNDAFEIGKQFLAKMNKDMYDYDPVNFDNIMVNFNPNAVRFEKLKAIGDNCFGYRFEFEYSKYEQLAYDDSNWSY
jgi:hypothetical protein